MRVARGFCLLLILASLSPTARAVALSQNNTISVGRLWTLPTAPPAFGNLTPAGAVDIYGSITNQGPLADAVTGVTSLAGSKAVFVVWAKALQLSNPLPLPLPNGKTITLEPETQFLRLTGGQAGGWKTGESFPLIFHFQHARDAKVTVLIQTKQP